MKILPIHPIDLMKYQIRRNIRRESVSSFFTTFDVEFIASMHAKASTVGRSKFEAVSL